jgi:hypothetical protein
MTLEAVSPGDTILDQLNAHSTDPSCSGCHNQIDPLGMTFEHYDHLGTWRENWVDGQPIPTQGTILGQEFSSLPEMLTIIAHSREGQACYAKHWVEYALARPIAESDQCALEKIQETFIQSDGNLHQLLYSIATSSAFWEDQHED